MIPDDLQYTEAHEWVRELGGGIVRIGITDHAQTQLGEVVYVQLPDVGSDVAAGTAVGEVESTKSVSDVLAPVTGTVTVVNAALSDDPAVVNSDPYGKGWMFEVQITADAEGLLDAAAYEELVGT